MAQPVLVRQAVPSEHGLALPLLERFFSEEGFTTPREQIREQLAALLAGDESAVFLAWVGSAAVGVATVTTTHGLELGLSAELEDLYVLPGARSRGIGAMLIDATRAWCRDRGCLSVSVVVTPEGQEAHNLIEYYRRRGFDETGRTILLAHLDLGEHHEQSTVRE